MRFYLVEGVKLFGGFQGATGGAYEQTLGEREVTTNLTYLSGNINNLESDTDNSFHVVVGAGVNAFTVLDGFVITKGYANGTGDGASGGGMFNDGVNPTVRNCLFLDNYAYADGGAMLNTGGAGPAVVNCIFSGNQAAANGGAVANADGEPSISNCVLSANSADYGGGLYESGSSTSTLTSCIIWGNTATSGQDGVQGSPTITYSDVQMDAGVFPGDGNINALPLFVDADGDDDVAGTVDDDLRLLGASPCIDAGDNEIDTDPVTTGLQSVPLTDLDGNPRRLDDPNTENTGNGDSPVVDMGAYEYVPPVTVESWETWKTHSGLTSQDLAITLDHTSDCGTSEPREDGVTWIIVTFDGYAGELVDGTITAVHMAGDTPGNVDSTSAFMSDGNTKLTITYTGLADVQCYKIDLDGELTGPLTGDSDCRFVNLYGDVDGDFNVTLNDAITAKDNNGQPVAAHPRCDLDLDNNITLNDALIAKDQNGHAADCCEEERGGGGGEMMARASGVSGSFVQHGTGLDYVVLPSEGGTIVVDLLIDSDTDLLAFEGKVGIDACNVVSIESANWGERENVLLSYDEGDYELASYYDFNLMDWYLAYEDGSIEAGTDATPLLEDESIDVLTFALSLDDLSGLVCSGSGSLYTTATWMGGVFGAPLESGETVVATLSLEVAGVEGTYHLSLADGRITDDSGQLLDMDAGSSFEITVQGE